MGNEALVEPRRGLRRRSTATLVVMLILGIYWAALFLGTHVPLPAGALPGGSDKLLHFSAFFGLGVLLMTLRATRGPFRWTSVLARWCVLACYGMFDEITQDLVGRDAEFYDWVADSFGAATGIVLVTWICWTLLGLKKIASAGSAD